jgi:hypothetical protein
MKSYHALRIADMPISAVSVPCVFSMIESLFLGYHLESTRRQELAEFKVIILVVLEPRNPHLNKDGATALGAQPI